MIRRLGSTRGCLGALAIALLVFAGPLACASAPPRDACPDMQSTRCVTSLECAYDARRGCTVCRCAQPPYVRPEQGPPTGR